MPFLISHNNFASEMYVTVASELMTAVVHISSKNVWKIISQLVWVAFKATTLLNVCSSN
jgi:hypothetical protein